MDSGPHQTDKFEFDWLATDSVENVQKRHYHQVLRETQRKYSNILRLARALTSHFYHVVQTQVKQTNDSVSNVVRRVHPYSRIHTHTCCFSPKVETSVTFAGTCVLTICADKHVCYQTS